MNGSVKTLTIQPKIPAAITFLTALLPVAAVMFKTLRAIKAQAKPSKNLAKKVGGAEVV